LGIEESDPAVVAIGAVPVEDWFADARDGDPRRTRVGHDVVGHDGRRTLTVAGQADADITGAEHEVVRDPRSPSEDAHPTRGREVDRHPLHMRAARGLCEDSELEESDAAARDRDVAVEHPDARMANSVVTTDAVAVEV